MARRRKKRTGRNVFIWLLVAGATAACWWWVFWPADTPKQSLEAVALGPAASLTTDRPEDAAEGSTRNSVPEKGVDPGLNPAGKTARPEPARVKPLLTAGQQALGRNDPVAARAHFSEAMSLGIDEPELSRVRAELTRIAGETIFSPMSFDGDPLAERYIIKPGDTLAKIAKSNRVSADLLAEINDIADKNRIRAGQSIKIVKGPFRAVIGREAYTLDVYLGDTFVKHYRVGLGADGSTPAGEWRVKNKLTNPTYYPPRGGRVIAADDPQNPLGERWIGLEGVSGEAVGQQRYGIHGTIEPESIGQNSSMGCIRLFNEDAEALFAFLVPNHSTVTIN